jgi:hypothetical protein
MKHVREQWPLTITRAQKLFWRGSAVAGPTRLGEVPNSRGLSPLQSSPPAPPKEPEHPVLCWNVTRTHEADMSDSITNPKLDPDPGSNTQKDPDNWVSGDEPMTGAQASYLTTLCEEAKIDPPSQDLSKAEASKLIDELKAKLGR